MRQTNEIEGRNREKVGESNDFIKVTTINHIEL
jgi:hypothetical protein